MDEIRKKKEKAIDIYFRAKGKRKTPYLTGKVFLKNSKFSKKEQTRKHLKKIYLEHIEAKKAILMKTKDFSKIFKKRGYDQVEREKRERHTMKEEIRKQVKEELEAEKNEGDGLDEEERILQAMEREANEKEIEEEKRKGDTQPGSQEKATDETDKEFGCLLEDGVQEVNQSANQDQEKNDQAKKLYPNQPKPRKRKPLQSLPKSRKRKKTRQPTIRRSNWKKKR